MELQLLLLLHDTAAAESGLGQTWRGYSVSPCHICMKFRPEDVDRVRVGGAQAEGVRSEERKKKL